MKYRYLTSKPDYSDFASGKVLLGLPGQVATPLRLVDELFQNGLDILRASGLSGPVTVFDPCCGTAYHLAALAFLHWRSISRIVASDTSADALSVAEQNLRLLTVTGLDQRAQVLGQLYEKYGKESHREAIETADRLAGIRKANGLHAIATQAFQADALSSSHVVQGAGVGNVDLVLSDVPYGLGSKWESPLLDATPEIVDPQVITGLLTSLAPTLSLKAVVCLLTSKSAKVSHPSFTTLRRVHAGKRGAIILQKAM